ncbi:MAG: carbonic anhydrase [Armatimonadota bacterium]
MKKLTGVQVLKKLLEGNNRFISGKTIHPNQTPKHRLKLAKAQHPVAVIVCCSDSRVCPEIIFDMGLGDLFEIRLAGNIVGDVSIGSIEYAVKYLNVGLILVLGHKGCGAVNAAMQKAKMPGHIGSLTEAIKPALKKAQKKQGDLFDNTVKSNVELFVDKLKKSKPILSKAVNARKLKIAGAVYDWHTGLVTLI